MTTDNQMTANANGSASAVSDHPPAPSAASPAADSASAPIPARNGRAKTGAPAGNTNAQAHGVWSFLALGRLPKGASYIRRLMGELRTQLERCVVQVHGQVSLGHAATITTVCRHEGRALLLSRYLATEGDALPIAQRVPILEAIGRATDSRDKAIAALDIDRDATADAWAQYDAHLARQRALAVSSDSSVSPAATASNGHVGDGGPTR